MNEVHIIQPEQWRAYRDIRLAALKDSPDAFGSIFEDAILYSDAVWRERVQDINPNTDLPMTILEGAEFVALGWVRIEQPEVLTANLYSMWVAPKQRGRGYGRLLVAAAINWARHRGMQELALDVTCGNVEAEALYQSMGFRPVGTPIRLRPDSALMEQPMRLKL